MKLLETQWVSYRNQVLPKQAPPIQVQECRRAFYAGACAYQHLAMMLGEDQAGTATVTERLKKLNEEIHEFTARVLKEWA